MNYLDAHDPGGKVKIALAGGLNGLAVLSACGRYRPYLSRAWADGPTIVFIGMNPSVADADHNDPTVTREMNFAARLGGGKYIKCNVMDYRATDPKAILKLDPALRRSPDNDAAIQRAVREAAQSGGLVIAAWGALHKDLRHYAHRAAQIVEGEGVALHCLGRTKDGSPRHPLYLNSDAELQWFAGAFFARPEYVEAP